MQFCRENNLQFFYCHGKAFKHICEAGLDRKIAFRGRPASYDGLVLTKGPILQVLDLIQGGFVINMATPPNIKRKFYEKLRTFHCVISSLGNFD